VHEWFEEQAERTPDAVAVVCEDQQLTYRQLDERANRLANYLRGLGVGAEVVVGVLAERSPDVITGLLAILKAGGAYLPLDPGHPRERLAFMLQDADVSCLLCQQQLLAAVPLASAQVLCLDRVLASTTKHSESDATRAVHPDSLAYVIYTSGSTGKPKGVVVSNRALADHCCEIQQRYGLAASDRVLQFASLGFDASLEQILATLITGATLVLADTSPWTPQEFYDKMLDPGLTVANLPPEYWHELLREWSRREDLLPDARMRLVIAGGDVLRPETVTLWRKAPTRSLRMLNAYGPTETTITATTFQVAQADGDGAEGSVPIGRPLPNRRAYILDKHGGPVPIGVRGELHLGGCCLARGYLGRPDLTAQQFVCDPFSHQPGARMYRTGDVARYLPDGNIDFLGRLDQQVKIRGFRIELGEIETILSQHAAVRDAVVAARESAAGDRRLVGYVVPESGREPEPSELRGFLREKLPPYMVPSAFVWLETLPLTPSGKVDRAALPMPETAGVPRGAFVAPSTPVQDVLAGVWVQVLGVERVGIHDNFFDLGGHSLLATQVISRIQDLLKVQLPLRALFEAPTVAELSQVVTASEATPGDLDETARILASMHDMSGKAVGEPVQDSPTDGGEH
jgi:amino acid adenylation domain-containing protein